MSDEKQPLKIYENVPDGNRRATKIGWVQTGKTNSELRYGKKR